MTNKPWRMLDIRSLLDGDLSRIRNVIRFSNASRIKDESVAEHSFFTAYYSLVLAYTLMVKERVGVDIGELLSSAILHDLDESKSGDFVRHFKYLNKETKNTIESTTDKLMQQAFLPLFSEEARAEYGNEPACTLRYIWKNAKNPNTLEGDIVAFADFLSVLSYVMNELDSGNKKLLRQLDDMEEYAKSFKRRSFIKYDEVGSWLNQVMLILKQYGMKQDD